MLAAGLYYAFNFNNKGTMDFLTNETQINSATAIITSLKRGIKKVYDYLVSVGAQKTTDATLDLENLLSQYQKTMRSMLL
jgi:hypothetical protein